MKTDTTLPLPAHPLDVEKDVADYAIGLAYAAHLKNEADALELLGIDAAAWTRARAWPDRLVEEVERGQRALVVAFGAAFKDTQARLRGAVEPAPAAPPPPPPELGPALLAQLSDEAAARPAPALEVGAPLPSRELPPASSTDEPKQVSTPPRTVSPTELGGERSQPRRPTMPFDPNRPSALADPVAAPARSPRGDGIDLDATAEAPVLPVRAALPFVTAEGAAKGPPAAGASSHELTVEQYASLCATLEAFPEKAPIILERYGITEGPELERLHATWHARFATGAASGSTFQHLLRDLRSRLGSSK